MNILSEAVYVQRKRQTMGRLKAKTEFRCSVHTHRERNDQGKKGIITIIIAIDCVALQTHTSVEMFCEKPIESSLCDF